MRQLSDLSGEQIGYVVGDADALSGIGGMPAMRVFDERATAFLSDVSGALLKDSRAKAWPDVVTFAFWCRRAGLKTLAAEAGDAGDRLGRGTVFHIAPSNVPVNFAYSLAAGMLAGNSNVVRVSSKEFPQTAIIADAMNRELGRADHAGMRGRICVVRYGRDREINDLLSMACDTRVVWGGDATIAEIRKSPLPPRSNEIAFADRYSICLIDADRYLGQYDPAKVAADFYNDTYLTDQNACTSPRAVFWRGEAETVGKAQEVFWSALAQALRGTYDISAVQTVDKLDRFYRLAAETDARIRIGGDWSLIRVSIPDVTPSLSAHFGNSGYFLERRVDAPEDVLPLCGRKCQTLSYLGFDAEELRAMVLGHAPAGVDRIVPIGATMEFSLVWDGVDLIRAMSREVSAR
jgi:hypothetical protein